MKRLKIPHGGEVSQRATYKASQGVDAGPLPRRPRRPELGRSDTERLWYRPGLTAALAWLARVACLSRGGGRRERRPQRDRRRDGIAP